MPHIDTSEPVTVSRADLDTLVRACLRYLPGAPDDLDPALLGAFRRISGARYEDDDAGEPEPEPLPDGIFGRVELPGYRQHTGWITEETRFGLPMAVIRDWDARVVAEVALGPGSQVVHLPTPLKRPESPAALTAGDDYDDDNEPLRWRDD